MIALSVMDHEYSRRVTWKRVLNFGEKFGFDR